MSTYYVVFHANNRVDVEEKKNFEEDSYVWFRSRDVEAGRLEYYCHKSKLDFYRSVYDEKVFG